MGANSAGKSTIFSVFGFLRDAMNSNVNAAPARLGGSRGFKEVRSRNSQGPIEIELKFRVKQDSSLTTYFLQINEKQGKAQGIWLKATRWVISGSRGFLKEPTRDEDHCLFSRRTVGERDARRSSATHSPRKHSFRGQPLQEFQCAPLGN